MAQSYHPTSLYIADLHPDVNEAMLHERFSPAGAILSIRLCRDMKTKRSLGYAYVNFTNHQDAECALHTINFEPINGHPCRIMWSQRDPGLRKSGFIDNKALFDTFSGQGRIIFNNVYVKNFGSEWTEQQFHELFSQYGEILSIKVSLFSNLPAVIVLEWLSYGFVLDNEERSRSQSRIRVLQFHKS